jgi:hypothetical protein
MEKGKETMTHLKKFRQALRKYGHEHRRHTRKEVKKIITDAEKASRYSERELSTPLCNYLDCAWGMGLAGRGVCGHGDYRKKDCLGFEPEPTDEEIEEAKENFRSIPCR